MKQTAQHRVSVQGNKASKSLTEKTSGVEVVGETPSLTEEFIGEIHRVLECIQNPSTKKSASEGSNLLVGSGGGDWEVTGS